MSNEEKIQEQVEAFTRHLQASYDLVEDPDQVKWVIFSTGKETLERTALDLIVDSFLQTIKGVFIFRADDAKDCEKQLVEALQELRKYASPELLLAKSAEEHGYNLTIGTPGAV